MNEPDRATWISYDCLLLSTKGRKTWRERTVLGGPAYLPDVAVLCCSFVSQSDPE